VLCCFALLILFCCYQSILLFEADCRDGVKSSQERQLDAAAIIRAGEHICSAASIASAQQAVSDGTFVFLVVVIVQSY
jgi:hypothetical protein